MNHTWSDLNRKWDGFRLTRYWLNFEKVTGLPLNEERYVEGKLEKIPTTVGEIYKRFADKCDEIEDTVLATEITIGTEKTSFSGLSFNHVLLTELLKLRKEGFEPFSAVWYFYDSDSCMDEPHEVYSFFVVCNDKIVSEQVSFRDYIGNGFDPSVFQADDNSDSSWRSGHAWEDAGNRFWYQKFYTETRIGQLMVLRDDKPKLYGRQSNHEMPALFSGNALRLLSKIQRLLWILIVLGGLILIRLWR